MPVRWDRTGKNKGKHDKGGGAGRAQAPPAKRADIAAFAPEVPAKAPAKAVVAAKAAPPPAPAKAEQKVAAVLPVAPAAPVAPKGAAWGDPIARFEARWTWLESRLITFVLLSQLAALVSWVFLNGLSESVGQSAGVVFRAVMVAIAFGLGTWFGFRKMVLERRRALTLVAIGLGLCLAPAWREAVLAAAKPGASATVLGLAHLDKASAGYFDNVKGWLQEGSTLTLMGGLRGLGTRLTLWLALLGGSLATAAGKHIHIDVIFRFLPKKLRIPAAIVNYIAAALGLLRRRVGLLRSHRDRVLRLEGRRPRRRQDRATPRTRSGDHFFFTRKQLGLDLRSLPARAQRRALRPVDDAPRRGTSGSTTPGSRTASRPRRSSRSRSPTTRRRTRRSCSRPTARARAGSSSTTLGLVFPFGLLVDRPPLPAPRAARR